jgi:hypothetical protein
VGDDENRHAPIARQTQQQLQDRRRPDDLHAGRVLRPADGVADRARLVRAALLPEGLATFRNAPAAYRSPTSRA